MFWFPLQPLSEISLILRRTEWYMIKNIYTGLQVKYMLFLSDFSETWIYSTVFWKILKYHVLWKSVQWEPSCSKQTNGWTGGQMDITSSPVAILQMHLRTNITHENGVLTLKSWIKKLFCLQIFNSWLQYLLTSTWHMWNSVIWCCNKTFKIIKMQKVLFWNSQTLRTQNTFLKNKTIAWIAARL